MGWDERQKQLLQAMGLRLWSPPVGAGAVAQERPVSTDRALPADAAVPAGDARILPAPTRPVAKASAVAPAPMSGVPEAAAVARMDWADLRQAAEGCRACGLCEGRRQVVFGAGNVQAHWLIVGEAPGAQEDEQGEPFVGASGQLLDAMLHALGLTRQAQGDPGRSVYIANTLKCRPPGNRNPQAQEMAACAPFLERQIALLQPRIVLAMGRYAVQALLNSTAPLGQLRGQVHRRGDSRVIATYHPSYLLRSPSEKAKAWADLCLAAAEAEKLT